jgi:hypothetical protein
MHVNLYCDVSHDVAQQPTVILQPLKTFIKLIAVMKKNMGPADRIIRILLAALFISLYVAKAVEGAWGLVLAVVGGILLLTSLVNFCPLYTILGINTSKVKKA